jgi:hypothetical protein
MKRAAWGLVKNRAATLLPIVRPVTGQMANIYRDPISSAAHINWVVHCHSIIQHIYQHVHVFPTLPSLRVDPSPSSYRQLGADLNKEDDAPHTRFECSYSYAVCVSPGLCCANPIGSVSSSVLIWFIITRCQYAIETNAIEAWPAQQICTFHQYTVLAYESSLT